jgi:hypothetical protein
MTKLEAVELIENRLGQRNGTALRERILAELKAAQAHYERGKVLPWFLRKVETVTLTSSPGTLSSSFLRELEDESLIWLLDGTTMSPLGKDNYETLSREEELTGTGAPKFYALEGSVGTSRYALFPRPDQSYSAELHYYCKDTTETLWLNYIPDLLISYAGLQMARALRSPESIQIFTMDLAEALQMLHHGNVSRDMAARSMVMGG